MRPSAPTPVPGRRDPNPPRSNAADLPDADVERARRAVRNTEPLYGRRAPKRGAAASWQTFVHRYGWRAYALPILVVLTLAALLTTHQVSRNAGRNVAAPRAGAPASNTAPPTAAPSANLKADSGGAKINSTALAAAALPAGPSYSMQGSGRFTVLKGSSPVVGAGKLYRYSVEVENGISGIDLKQFQSLVVSTLSNSQSWSGHGVAVQRVDSGRVDFHVSLTSSMSVRKFCGYSIPVETSCYIPAGNTSNVNRVVFNDSRWVRGSAAYVGDLAAYRIYMINHEDGHALGHEHAHQCLPGGLAPVMMQQTFGLRSAATDKFCQANPWPYPKGVAGTPGAEQLDTAKNDEYGIGD